MKRSDFKKEQAATRIRHHHIIESQIFPFIAISTLSLDEWQIKLSRDLQLAEADPQSKGWKTIRAGDCWGGNRVDCWFAKSAVLPKHFIGKKLMLRLCPGSEGLLYINGEVQCGIDPNHTTLFLKGLKKMDILLGMHSGWTNSRWATPHGWTAGIVPFTQADLSLFSEEAYKCYHYLKNLSGLILDVRTDAATARFLKEVFDETVRRIALQRPGSTEYYKSLPAAIRYFENTLFMHGVKADLGMIHLIGHSHLDVIYLWPLSQTVHKASRMFSSMLTLMDRYKAFRFMQSSALLYQLMKDRFPRIYRQIKARVASGQWQITGGMWLESDCNIPGGESLVRQFLYGQRFFRKEFGRTCTVCWLPDVFGFNANLPQIMVKSGIRYFSTAKMLFNIRYPFPYQNFKWRARDGSSVIAAYPPLTYGVILSPEAIQTASDQYREKQPVGPVPITYGHSDGGGGVSDSMIQCAETLSKILPDGQIRFSTLEAFFKRIEQTGGLKTWNDELYLERHQGTFTTEARTKLGNRRCEQELRQAEILSVMALLNGGADQRNILQRCWKKLLLNQFHDAITGTCVVEATNLILKDYAEILKACKAIFAQSLRVLLSKEKSHNSANKNLVVFNLSSDRTSGFARFPARDGVKALRDMDGKFVPVQQSADGKELFFFAADLPQMGFKTYTMECSSSSAGAKPNRTISADRSGRVENDFYVCRLTRKGEIDNLFFKPAGTVLIDSKQPANEFQFFEDIDKVYDAWDIYSDYEKKPLHPPSTTGFSLKEKGPLRVVYCLQKQFQSSTIRQEIIFYAHTASIDFATEVDWQERHVLLKTAFPVNVNSPFATYEIQYSSLKRAVKSKSRYEKTKYEVPAQRWADLSVKRYGVSLLNNCKYGYDIKNNVMRLTLLRAPTLPNPSADQGDHKFTYSIFFHLSDWSHGGTLAEARELNEPLRVFEAVHTRESFSLLSSANENVIIETVKPSEEGKDVIIRVYEAWGMKSTSSIKIGFKVAGAFETNLLEDNIRPVKIRNNYLRFIIHPFEIKTFRLVSRRSKGMRGHP